MNDIGPKDANVEIRDPAFHGVVGDAIPLERIATGFLFTEGPLWHAREKYLLFSDMPGDHMRKWSGRGEVATFRKPCAQSIDAAVRLHHDIVGAVQLLASVMARNHGAAAVRLGAGDLAGRVLAHKQTPLAVPGEPVRLFSDPTYGRNEYYGNPRPLPRDFRGVYRAEPSADKLTLLADDFGQPNGLCFSRDERRLFVNDTDRQHIRVFDVRPDGTLGNSRVWAETKGEGAGAPDGMKIDSTGNVYCCGPGGIHVFSPEAICLGVIRMPEYTANFCFGDDDLCSLYVTASTSVYRLRVRTPGTAQWSCASG
jgi:gluconolactonase